MKVLNFVPGSLDRSWVLAMVEFEVWLFKDADNIFNTEPGGINRGNEWRTEELLKEEVTGL